jgi:hypothetical protein
MSLLKISVDGIKILTIVLGTFSQGGNVSIAVKKQKTDVDNHTVLSFQKKRSGHICYTIDTNKAHNLK